MSTMSAAKLASVYIKIRDARKELQTKFDNEDAKLEDQLKIVQGKMLELCKETDSDSIRTSAGTITRVVKTRYTTRDWGALYDVIKEYDIPQLLEQRIAQTQMRNFLEEHPEVSPRGLDKFSQYAISVRRS